MRRLLPELLPAAMQASDNICRAGMHQRAFGLPPISTCQPEVLPLQLLEHADLTSRPGSVPSGYADRATVVH